MDDQQSDESFDLTEKIDKWLEKEANKRLESSINELGDLLDKKTEYVKEKVTNIFDIGKYTISINLRCNKRDDCSIWCEYSTEIHIYNFHNEDEEIACYSYTEHSSYKIKCFHRNTRLLGNNYRPFVYKSFELSNDQSISFLEDIKEKILDIHDILYPGVLKNLGKQYIRIRLGVRMDLKESIKKNPEIIKEDFYNLLIYNNGRYNIEIRWYFDKPSKS